MLHWEKNLLHVYTEHERSTSDQRCEIYTGNWHDLEFQIYGFLHVVPKEEKCITSHN